jgi:hypothetical protein
MTSYTVHLYREMRLRLSAIEAATPEAAARLAATMPTCSADEIDDCEGFTYSAQVPRDGEESLLVHLRADGGEIEPAPERVTNAHRAKWAEACVSVFIQHTGCDDEDALGDLLCDLMHFAHQRDYDLPAALDRALGHFEEELVDEGQVPPGRPGARSGRFAHAVAPLLEALEDLLPHAAQEVEDRKSTGVAEYDDLEEAVEKARAAVSAATKPAGSANPAATRPPKADDGKPINADPTPGPWAYNDSGLVYGSGPGDTDGPPFVCDVTIDCSMGLTPQEVANARLITSAPTMLDALLDIKRLASKHDDAGTCPYTLLELIEATAIVALAKTKGGAQ